MHCEDEPMTETRDELPETRAVLALLSERSGTDIVDNPQMRSRTMAELGISSVTFMVIVVELEDVLQRPLEGADIFGGVRTLGDLLTAIGVG
jgi:acyl carrier protein